MISLEEGVASVTASVSNFESETRHAPQGAVLLMGQSHPHYENLRRVLQDSGLEVYDPKVLPTGSLERTRIKEPAIALFRSGLFGGLKDLNFYAITNHVQGILI